MYRASCTVHYPDQQMHYIYIYSALVFIIIIIFFLLLLLLVWIIKSTRCTVHIYIKTAKDRYTENGRA